MMDYVQTIGKGLAFPLMALTILVGGTGCHLSPCPIWQSGDTTSQIKAASDPSWRIPRWTDDGQSVVFDYPGGGRDDNRDSIYIVDSNGVELKEWALADAPSSSSPFYVGDYAPDVMGDKVVFTTLRHACDGSKGYEIASANLDGSGYTRLTDADGSDMFPVWSPDGSRIAFVSNRIVYDDADGSIVTDQQTRENFHVYVMDVDGSNVRSIAPDIFIRSNRYLPGRRFKVVPPESLVWSPSGWLAFRDWQSETLYTVHPEKPGLVTVGQTSADPAWSPDGEWIAWVQTGTVGSIHVSRPDGTEAREVFDMNSVHYGTAGYDPFALSLSWTPDGSSLSFVFYPRRVYPLSGLYQFSLGESNLDLISDIPPWTRIVWSPDGSRALVHNLSASYSSLYDDGVELLYTMAADGSDKRVLVRYGPNGLVAGYGE